MAPSSPSGFSAIGCSGGIEGGYDRITGLTGFYLFCQRDRKWPFAEAYPDGQFVQAILAQISSHIDQAYKNGLLREIFGIFTATHE